MSRKITPSTFTAITTAVLVSVLGLAVAARPAWTLEFPGRKPGKATATLEGQRLTMQNAVIKATWRLGPERFGLVEAVDRVTGDAIRSSEAEGFLVTFADGRSLAASQFRRAAEPTLEALGADPEAVRARHRFAGWQARASYQPGSGRTFRQWIKGGDAVGGAWRLSVAWRYGLARPTR